MGPLKCTTWNGFSLFLWAHLNSEPHFSHVSYVLMLKSDKENPNFSLSFLVFTSLEFYAVRLFKDIFQSHTPEAEDALDKRQINCFQLLLSPTKEEIHNKIDWDKSFGKPNY